VESARYITVVLQIAGPVVAKEFLGKMVDLFSNCTTEENGERSVLKRISVP